MKMTEEERHQIYQEEKARMEIREELQKNKVGTTGVALFWGGGLVLVLFGLMAVGSLSDRPDHQVTRRTYGESTGNVAHNLLLQSDAGVRASRLGVIVTSSGDSCMGKDTFFMGMDPKDHEAYWSVRCTNGKSYEVGIEANATGTTGVVDCGILAAMNQPCFVKLDRQ